LVLCRQSFDLPLLTHWLPTLLAWAGTALLYVGAAEFRGRRALLKWPLLCCVPALAGYLWFGWASPLTWLRPAFYSTPTVLFLALAAREWLGEQRAGLRLISCCSGVAAVIYALSYVSRAWLIAIHRTSPDPLQDGGAQLLVIVSTLLWLFCWTYIALLLLNQWHHLEKLQFHEAQLIAQKNLVDAERQLALRERELLNERTLRQRDLLLRDLQDRLDIRTVAGNAAHPNVLEQAGAAGADMVVALTNSDEVNMVACQVAWSLFRTRTKIARIRSLEYTKRNELFFDTDTPPPDGAGFPVDVYISPEELVTQYVERLIRYSGALQVLDFADGKVRLVAVRDVDDAGIGSAVGGLRVAHLNTLPQVARREQVEMGVVAVPGPAAQAVVDAMVAAGLRSVLNFAPVHVRVPDDVAVRRVDLSTELQMLSFLRSRMRHDG
jgi:Trk K+ transport system NAD-binding subunit